MSFKVVKDGNGRVMAYGPNDDNYEPSIPEGCCISVESEEPQLPMQVPQEIDIMQAELILLQENLLDQVNAAIESQSRDMQIKWHRTTIVKRDDPLVNAVLSSLGLNDERIDQLFFMAQNK